MAILTSLGVLSGSPLSGGWHRWPWEPGTPISLSLWEDLGQSASHLTQAGLLKHLKSVWVSLKSFQLAIPFPYPR